MYQQPHKIHSFSTKFIIIIQIIFLAALMSQTSVCRGLSTDKNQPYQIHADRMEFSKQQHRTTLSGNASIQQGSTRLQGQIIILFQNEQNQVERILTTGSPAHYESLQDHQSEKLYAEADTIDYQINNKTVNFLKQAQIHQGGEILRGPDIRYNIDNGKLVSLGNQNNQTQIIIPPQQAKQNDHTHR